MPHLKFVCSLLSPSLLREPQVRLVRKTAKCQEVQYWLLMVVLLQGNTGSSNSKIGPVKVFYKKERSTHDVKLKVFLGI